MRTRLKLGYLFAACGLFFTSAISSALAENVTVVELFTSQGCAACPPADEYFATLTDMADVVPLALHVDYWDYIGWKDAFANPRFTERQRAYARMNHSRTIYTPQFIINGKDRIEGLNPAETAERLASHLNRPSPVQISVQQDGAHLHVVLDADPPLDHPALVELVRYLPKRTVTIENGENAGKTVTYRNIVTSWKTLEEWSGQDRLEFEAEIEGTEPAVIIVQRPGPRTILAAASPG